MINQIKYIVLGLTLFFCHFITLGQKSQIDSLFTLLKTDREDTNKINHLNALAWKLKGINPDTAIILSNQVLQLAEKIKWKKGTAQCQQQLGVLNHIKGNFVLSLKHYQNALRLWEELIASQDIGTSTLGKKGKASTLGNIGLSYSAQADYLQALDYYLKALEIANEFGFKQLTANNLGNIASIYFDQAAYPKALEYYFKQLKINEELGDKNRIVNSLIGIGNVYNYQADYPKALDYYFKTLKMAEELGGNDIKETIYGNIGIVYAGQFNYPKALDYYFKALKIAEELHNKNGTARHLGNIATVFTSQADYIKALDFCFKALKLKEEIGDKQGIVVNLTNIGSLYTTTGKFNAAYTNLYRSLAIADSIKALDNMKSLYKMLSDLYEKSNVPLLDSIGGKILNKEEMRLRALHYFKSYMNLRDSIFSEENKKQLIRKEMNFDFEKKELATKVDQDKKNILAEKEKQKQKIITYSVSAGLLLVLLLALFIFRGYKQKQKANHIITQQKTEVENQKHLIEEKHKEITDSINYAERIQRSFLATKKLLDDNLNEYFVYFQPKDVVSGDFYWAAKLSTNNFLLATADSTGHGVPGAIMSILNISSLEKAVEQGLLEPSEIFNHTRKTIIERLKKDGSEHGGKDGMDCSLISFDFKLNLTS